MKLETIKQYYNKYVTRQNVLIFVLVYTVLYLVSSHLFFGWEHSISSQAKNWKAEGLIGITYSWVAVVSVGMGWLGRKRLLPILAAASLLIIGGATGYNYENSRLDNFIHVFATNLSIILILTEVFLQGKKRLLNRMFCYAIDILVVIFVIVSMLIIKYPHYTWWIEVFILSEVFLFYQVDIIKNKG